MRLEKAGLFVSLLELGTADVCMHHNCNRNKTTSNVKNTKLNEQVRRKAPSASGACGGGGGARGGGGRAAAHASGAGREPRACAGALGGPGGVGAGRGARAGQAPHGMSGR